MKMQKSTLPKFEISIILENWVSGKLEIGTSKPEIRFRFWILVMEFWILVMEIQNLSQKIEKSARQNLKFDFDLEFLGCKIENLPPKFKNLHLKTWNSISILNFRAGNLIFKIPNLIVFSNFFRISIRDHQIWNQRPRKPLNLHFRFKILIFASNFSSTKILILY